MPPRRRSTAVLLALLAALTLGLVGCGGDDDSGGTTTTAAEGGDEGSGRGATNTATIEMKDYAFAVEGELTTGTSTLELTNTGKEFHMAVFSLLKPGKTLADVQAALSSDDESAAQGVFEESEADTPGTVLGPGQTERLTTPLLAKAGTYAMICFIPAVGDAAPHFAKGMVTTVEVAQGSGGEAPEADAEYTIDDGGIEGPDTLGSGEQILQMTSSGEGPHEFFVVRKRDGATTAEDVSKAFGELFESGTPPAAGYTDTFPVVIHGSSFNVPTGRTIQLGVNLQPGTYIVGCNREPDEDEGPDAKVHTGEVVELKVT